MRIRRADLGTSERAAERFSPIIRQYSTGGMAKPSSHGPSRNGRVDAIRPLSESREDQSGRLGLHRMDIVDEDIQRDRGR